MEETNLFCIKFQFGVPLEDIFPSNDIHPQLQNLLIHTVWALRSTRQPLKHILRNFEISLHEALNLKERLVQSKALPSQISSSSFFWLLRHFLGLLPLPLFPRFTDGKCYHWDYLALKCRDRIDRNVLEYSLSWWIHKLPNANVMLIYALMNFFREICYINNLNWLDWKSVKALTRFFASSLFFRPFRPGCVSKGDKMFYPLFCFMIVNWNNIKRVKSRRFAEFERNIFLSPSSVTSVENSVVECATQTSFCLLEPQDKGGEIRGNITSLGSPSVSSVSGEDVSLHFQDELEDVKINFQTSTPEKEKSLNKATISLTENENEEDTEVGELPTYVEIKEPDESGLTKNKNRKFRKTISSHLITRRISKSLASVVTKMNEKIKSSQAVISKTNKYDLLEEQHYPRRVKSLDVQYIVKDSPQIKYEKLNTL